MSTINIGKVEFILIWERDDANERYVHKYEVTLGHFDSHTEILRMGDVLGEIRGGKGWVEKLSSEWMRIHSILSKKGLLRGR